MGDRRNVSSGSPYEPIIGFSRAVRIGRHVQVGGTAPIWPDGSCDPDPATQMRRSLEIVETALTQCSASLADVVRTRLFLTSVGDWEAIGRVHGEVFAEIRPASSVIIVAGFIDPRWKVELEVDAIVSA